MDRAPDMTPPAKGAAEAIHRALFAHFVGRNIELRGDERRGRSPTRLNARIVHDGRAGSAS